MKDAGRLFVAALLVAIGGCDDSARDTGDDSAASLTGSNPGAGASTGGQPDVTSGTGATGESPTSGDAMTGEDSSSSEALPEPPVVFDLGVQPDFGTGVFCGAPDPVVCDDMDDDPWHALGLNCPGGPQVDGSFSMGESVQLHVHEGNFGTFQPPAFPPREGNKMAILSSGDAQQMTMPQFGNLGISLGNGPLFELPDPMAINQVSDTENCADNPSLLGMGDCSNTIQAQFEQGGDAWDLAMLEFTVEVPAGTFGFSYDLAFLSVEYPTYYQTTFNDMYVAWLESEEWTGNVSFDEMGAPISLNAGFLDFKDAPNSTDCPAPCEAPELAGTAVEGHAATKWLTTSAPVVPGEQIRVMFTIFDLSDDWLDSAVLLDNFLWTCEGGPPITIPG